MNSAIRSQQPAGSTPGEPAFPSLPQPSLSPVLEQSSATLPKEQQLQPVFHPAPAQLPQGCMRRRGHTEITAFKTTGYKNSTVLREGKSGFPTERRPGTAAAGLLATKPLDPATCAYLEPRPARPGERVRAEGLWGQTHSNTTTELPTSPTATQGFWSQREKSWMAATTAQERSQIYRSPLCVSNIFFSIVTCPYLHSGCP